MGTATAGEAAPAAGETSGATAADVVAEVAAFAELSGSSDGPNAASLDRLLDVDVTATAELGRTVLSIADVLKLNIGSVLELDRPLSEPVDVMVQGVALARRSGGRG